MADKENETWSVRLIQYNYHLLQNSVAALWKQSHQAVLLVEALAGESCCPRNLLLVGPSWWEHSLLPASSPGHGPCASTLQEQGSTESSELYGEYSMKNVKRMNLKQKGNNGKKKIQENLFQLRSNYISEIK